jgi:histidyl-tRNA synthetase
LWNVGFPNVNPTYLAFSLFRQIVTKSENINYKLPSGFDIEFLPGEKRLEQHLIDTIRHVFESYGFTPIETPAVERLEVLQAKGNQGDNIIYSISPLLTENQAEESASDSRGLKFDQTVPLAAYVARHLNDLTFPFARYQMDMVFRGERAKKGRYRQFRQCDIDVVGRANLSLLYDAQMPAIIAQIFSAIKIGKFLIRISNRKVLKGMFRSVGVKPEQIKSCVKIVDTLDKVGKEKVKQALANAGISLAQTDRVIDFLQINGSVDEVLERLVARSQNLADSEEFTQGVMELQQVIEGVRSLGVAPDCYCIDLSIARGLDYYTGTVYETTLLGYESLGSICSGGRYEELVGLFAGETLPGVGISIGFTRLLRQLIDLQILKPLSSTPAQVMVLNMQSHLMGTYLQVSQRLRASGIKVLTEFSQQAIAKQFKRADRLGIPLCIAIGDDEYRAQTCRIKVLATGNQIDVPMDDLVEEIQKLLLSSGE